MQDVRDALIALNNDSEKGKGLNAGEIRGLLTQIVRLSANPVLTSLIIAKLLSDAASLQEREVADASKPVIKSFHYDQEAVRFLRIAVSCVDKVPYEYQRMNQLLKSNITKVRKVTTIKGKEVDLKYNYSALDLAVDMEHIDFFHCKNVHTFLVDKWRIERSEIIPFTNQNLRGGIEVLLQKSSWDKAVGQSMETSISETIGKGFVTYLPARFVFDSLMQLFYICIAFSVVRERKSQPDNMDWSSLESLFLFFFIGYVLREVEELVMDLLNNSRNSYVSNMWNWLDWASCILVFVYFVLRIVSISNGDTALNLSATEGLGFTAVVMSIRILSVLSVSMRLGPLIRSLLLMFRDVFNFSILFSFVLLGFSTVFFLLFREGLEEFSTLHSSAYHLFLMTTGHVDMAPVIGVHAVLGPILFISFLLIGGIMMLNILIAVLSKTFENVHVKAEAESSMMLAREILNFEKSEAAQLAWYPARAPVVINVVLVTLYGIVNVIVLLPHKVNSLKGKAEQLRKICCSICLMIIEIPWACFVWVSFVVFTLLTTCFSPFLSFFFHYNQVESARLQKAVSAFFICLVKIPWFFINVVICCSKGLGHGLFSFIQERGGTAQKQSETTPVLIRIMNSLYGLKDSDVAANKDAAHMLQKDATANMEKQLKLWQGEFTRQDDDNKPLKYLPRRAARSSLVKLLEGERAPSEDASSRRGSVGAANRDNSVVLFSLRTQRSRSRSTINKKSDDPKKNENGDASANLAASAALQSVTSDDILELFKDEDNDGQPVFLYDSFFHRETLPNAASPLDLFFVSCADLRTVLSQAHTTMRTKVLVSMNRQSEEKMKNLKGKLTETLNKNAAAVDRLKEKYHNAVRVLADQLSDTQNELDNAVSLSEDMAEKINELRERLTSTIEELHSTRVTLKETQETLAQTQQELASTKATLEQTRSTLRSTESKLEQTQEKLEETEQTLNQTKSDLKETKSDLAGVRSELATTRSELNEKRETLRQTESQLRESQSVAQKKSQEVERLRQQLGQ
eukprot:GILI01002459.1.p1 GENE.GILI01002459.1~~GILI01002459.1.p1  ORF type:complete len:1099 (-),score=340.99 GILI01002459.1:230-3307(-)